MTQEQRIIKTKVGLLELGKQLGNVSKACQTTVGIAFIGSKNYMRLAEKPRWRRFLGGSPLRRIGSPRKWKTR